MSRLTTWWWIRACLEELRDRLADRAKRFIAQLGRVPPLWWARFVFLAMIVSLVLAGFAVVSMRRAVRDIAESQRELQHTLQVLDRVVDIADSLASGRWVQLDSNDVLIRR